MEDDGGGHDDAVGEDRVGACVAVRVVGGNLLRHILVGDGVATGGRGAGDETSGVHGGKRWSGPGGGGKQWSRGSGGTPQSIKIMKHYLIITLAKISIIEV